jgi:hypothetical protein
MKSHFLHNHLPVPIPIFFLKAAGYGRLRGFIFFFWAGVGLLLDAVNKHLNLP